MGASHFSDSNRRKPNSTMKIELTDLKENAYVNFIESKQSYQTRRNYTRDLEGFLKLIPEHIHVDYVNTRPM